MLMKRIIIEKERLRNDACKGYGEKQSEDNQSASGDSIIIGASKADHLKQNMETVKAGPLSDAVVDAFEKAWQHCKADCPEYFTLYKGKGSVGGEKK